MSGDTDILTLLRAAATDDAPALTLQAADLVRAGRRRVMVTRVASVSAGVAGVGVIAALAVAVPRAGQDDAPSPPPADRASEVPPPAASLHMMPALLKGALLSEFGTPTPDWKTFDIAARGVVEGRDPSVPLPEPLWDQASQWTVKGTTDDRGIDLRLVAGDFAGTKGDPAQFCESVMADGSLSCTHDELPDGRVAITRWERDEQGGVFGTAGLGGPWIIQDVQVYSEGSGYVITVRQGVQASSLRQAREDVWLDDAAMLRIASSRDTELAQTLLTTTSGGINVTGSQSQ